MKRPDDIGTANLKADSPWPRLDHFLAAHLENISRTRIQSLIRAGLVRVDGEPVLKSRVALAGGEQIQVDIPPPEVPAYLEPEDIPFTVLYEDDQIIVINKPAGLVTHPGHGVHRGTLVNGLVGRYNSLSERNGVLRPGIVHRLDKDTSGVMVVARTERAHVSLARQFERREVRKVYLALVWGNPPESGRVEANLIRDPHHRLQFRISPGRGRPAVTAFRLLERFQGFALLEVQPHTGRTHQIRVHLAHLGYPIYGDTMYRGVRAAENVAPELRMTATRLRQALSRQALHAYQLAFCHPATDRAVTFKAPLAEDFDAALQQLRLEAGG